MQTLFPRLLLALACMACLPAQATVIFDQLADAPAGYAIVATVSDTDAPLQIGDDFTLSTSHPVRITQIDWVGRTSADLFAQGGDTLGFMLRFFRFVDGTPLSMPFADFDVTGQFTETATRNVLLSLYSVVLDRPLTLPDNGTYLFSVVANTPDSSNNWYWFLMGGPTMAYNRSKDGDAWTTRIPRSYSFRLSGYVVPEPSTLVLMSLALMALGLSRCRRYTT